MRERDMNLITNWKSGVDLIVALAGKKKSGVN